MGIVAIKGATTVNKNSKVEILENTKELIINIEEANELEQEKVISIIFSITKDLNAAYPAKAARALGYTNCSLMCFNEADVVGSIEKCIRLMMLYDGNIEQKKVNHIYLKDAKVLRPDLIK